MTTSRLEAFSDGVLAIAITLLVFEIRPPELQEGEPLAHALWAQWPSYVAYLVSFLTIGVIWLNHHRVFEQVVRVDGPLLVLNLNLLLWTGLIPFPTAVPAEHLGDGGEAARTASALYCGVLLLMGLAFEALFAWVTHTDRLLHRLPPPGVVPAARMRFMLGQVVYAAALALSWVSAPLAVALCGLMALYYAFDQASVPAAAEPDDQQPTGRSAEMDAADPLAPRDVENDDVEDHRRPVDRTRRRRRGAGELALPLLHRGDGRCGRRVLGRADTLLGRKTYQDHAAAWPEREAAGGEDAEFAKVLGDARKLVVSRQRPELSRRNSEQLQGDLVRGRDRLKQGPGGPIAMSGSVSVVRQLLVAGLLDELRLLLHPIAVRQGMRLFDEGDAPIPLELLSSQAFSTGVLHLVYGLESRPARPAMRTPRCISLMCWIWRVRGEGNETKER